MVIYCTMEQLTLIFVDWILSSAMLKVYAPPPFLYYPPVVRLLLFALFVNCMMVRVKEFFSPFVLVLSTYSTRRSSRLSASNDPARDYCLAVLGSFKHLDRCLRSWSVSAIQAWNSLPAPLLTDISKWSDVMKTLQHY